jgi:hypothetical protein
MRCRCEGGPQGQQSEVRGPKTAHSRIVDEAELLLQNLDGWKGIELFSSHSMIPPLRCSGDDTNSKSRAHDPLCCCGMRVVTLWTARGRVRAFRRIIGSRVRNVRSSVPSLNDSFTNESEFRTQHLSFFWGGFCDAAASYAD